MVLHREPTRRADGRHALEEVPPKEPANQQRRTWEASRTLGIQRNPAESAGLTTRSAAAAAPRRLDRTP
ncbi:hypothetical protein PUR49_00670 [Streptomyces sp. BE147]|uniref:hypothetical protein n=1 Tax=Streptomyces sp. BE147 TaxID=3002524 RepID=UPI002E77189A|nr:hypothetical protein [Streptomyces sp. BE147]MEE1735080.1 hypothetical protein [Streptomyces sp. BE147]